MTTRQRESKILAFFRLKRRILKLWGKAISYGLRLTNFLFKYDHAGLIDQKTLSTFLAVTVNLEECSRIAFLTCLDMVINSSFIRKFAASKNIMTAGGRYNVYLVVSG